MLKNNKQKFHWTFYKVLQEQLVKALCKSHGKQLDKSAKLLSEPKHWLHFFRSIFISISGFNIIFWKKLIYQQLCSRLASYTNFFRQDIFLTKIRHFLDFISHESFERNDPSSPMRVHLIYLYNLAGTQGYL